MPVMRYQRLEKSDILVLPGNTVHFYIVKHLSQNILMNQACCERKFRWYDCVTSLSYPFILNLYSNASKVDRNVYVVLKCGVSVCFKYVYMHVCIFHHASH